MYGQPLPAAGRADFIALITELDIVPGEGRKGISAADRRLAAEVEAERQLTARVAA